MQTQAIHDEAVRTLARIRERSHGSGDRELHALWLLALEREQIVTTAYAERFLAARVAAMPVPDAVRRLVRRSLIWIWRDEEMHASYVRGVLLHEGPAADHVRAYAQQLMGVLSGWAAAIRQNETASTAPVAARIAAAMLMGGRLTGRLTEPFERGLRHGPFNAFCRFNAALEDSAALCWQRVAQVATDEDQKVLAERTHDEEVDHSRVFDVFAGALDESDRLLPDVTPEGLATAVGEIGAWFLPGELRDVHPGAVATGAPIFVRSGADKRSALRRVVQDAGLPGLVAAKGRGARAVVKPAFMLGYNRGDPSTVTDPALVDELGRLLREYGCGDVAVVEAPTVYERWFRHRSVPEVASYFGFDSDSYRIVDASADQAPYVYARGMAQSTICRTWRDADVRIVMPKLRSNPSELAHLSFSTLEGLGARQDEVLFPDRYVHYRTATMMVVDAFPPDLSVVDAYDAVGDGTFGVMGCNRPLSPRRVYAGRDILAVDIAVLHDVGLDDPELSGMLRTALHWFGDPPPRDVHGDCGPIEGFRHSYRNPASTLMAVASYPVYVYGSRGGRLFTPQMDEQAFPPVTPPGPFVRTTRRAAQLAFGLRPGAASPT